MATSEILRMEQTTNLGSTFFNFASLSHGSKVSRRLGASSGLPPLESTNTGGTRVGFGPQLPDGDVIELKSMSDSALTGEARDSGLDEDVKRRDVGMERHMV